MSPYRQDRAAVRAQLDQEIGAAIAWMRGSDPAALIAFRSKLADDDSAAMLRSLTPAEADILARLAIIGFDEVALSGYLSPHGA
jgi:hypothetical protein